MLVISTQDLIPTLASLMFSYLYFAAKLEIKSGRCTYNSIYIVPSYRPIATAEVGQVHPDHFYTISYTTLILILKTDKTIFVTDATVF